MNNELKHYGVPGMRWGHRKKRIRSEDSIKTSNIRKKKVYEMTNQELQTANNRLSLERNYKSLTKKKNRAKDVVSGFIKTAGTLSAIVAAAATYKKWGDAAVDKIGDLIVKNIKF